MRYCPKVNSSDILLEWTREKELSNKITTTGKTYKNKI
jgi:hypothetical protein